MGDLTFGQPLGLLESAEYSSWVKNVFDAVRVLPLIQVIEYYPLLSKIYAFLEPKKVNEMKTTHFKHSADRVDRRLEQKSGELRSKSSPREDSSADNKFPQRPTGHMESCLVSKG